MGILILIPTRPELPDKPDKTFLNLCGNELWRIAFDNARVSERECGVECVTRISSYNPSLFPDEMKPYLVAYESDPTFYMGGVIPQILHAVHHVEEDGFNVEAVCLLQLTSVMRTSEDITHAIKTFVDNDMEHPVVTGWMMKYKVKGTIHDRKRDGRVFNRNGAVFITPKKMLQDFVILDGQEHEVDMPLSHSLDIDTEDDWMMCEAITEYRDKKANK